MMPRTEASHYLVEVLQYFTNLNNKGWKNCPNCASNGPSAKTEVEIIEDLLAQSESTAEAFTVYRELYGQSHCSLCTALVLLKAIETIMPDEQVPHWMEGPNEELNGQTPLDCILEGSFDSVFESLWHMETALGPAS